MRKEWEQIVKEADGYIPEHVRKCINQNFIVETEILRLQESFKYITRFGMDGGTEDMILAEFLRLMVVFEPKDVNIPLTLMEGKRKHYSNRPLEITGIIGILVRMIAKLCRLHNMVTNDLEGNDESIDDTKQDIFNYCIIGFEFSKRPMEYSAKLLMKVVDNECK